jgi:hypothetical protein
MAYDEKALEDRIRLKAYEIWMEEGRPQGREKEHWELAKFAIAQQDGLSTTLLPPEPPRPEPIEAVKNQAEFPTLTDQGEGQLPGEKRWNKLWGPSTNRSSRSKAKSR